MNRLEAKQSQASTSFSFHGGLVMSRILVLVLILIVSLTACLTPPEPTAIKDEEAPEAPVILSAIPADASIMLSWEASTAEDLAAYVLYWGTTEEDLSDSKDVDAELTSTEVDGLVNGTMYYFALKAVDASDNASDASVVVQGAPVAPDTTAPTVASSTPANNSTDAAVSVAFVFNFSEAMDVATVSLSVSPEVALDEAVWNDERTSVSFKPSADLAFDTAYVLTLAGSDESANALSGTTVFNIKTAAVPDTTAPTVISNSPSDGSAGVAPSSNLSISFSEAMNKASVEAAFSSNVPVSCVFLWSADATLMTCDPSSDLAFSSLYEISLSTAAKDLAGNPLAAIHSFSFKTSVAPDTTKPTLVSSSPVNNAIGVERESNIVIKFSEPMDKASAQAAFSVTSPAFLNIGSFSWNAAGTIMTFNPSFIPSHNTTIKWTVSTAAKDSAGNTLAVSTSGQFRTLRIKTIKIYSTDSLDGTVSNNGNVQTGAFDVFLGDLANNTYQREFLSFDMTSLPSNLIRLTAANLYSKQIFVGGNPYTDLGRVYVRSVDYGSSLNANDFEKPTSGSALLSNNGNITFKSANVFSMFKSDWTNRAAQANRAQFRLSFNTNVSTDAQADLVAFCTSSCPAANRPYVQVSYEYP